MTASVIAHLVVIVDKVSQYSGCYESATTRGTGWRIPIEYLLFTRHVPRKSPILSGFLAKNDLQLKVFHESSPNCIVNQ